MIAGAGLAVTAALLLGAPAYAQGYGSSMQNHNATPQATPTQQMPTTTGTMGSQTTATQPVTEVSDPASKLASASVRDSTGQSVGQVQSVQTANGRARSVKVSLTTTAGGSKVVSIRASKLRYDPNGNSLVTTLTSSQINSLPAAQNP
jgi:hypothetical protein